MRYLALALLFFSLLGTDALAQGIVLERVIVEDQPRPTPPPPEQDGFPARWAMQLREHRVAIEIEDQAVRTEVTEVFYNPNAWPMEGVYLFPLPDNASVSRFTMSMAGKDIPGELLDRDRARDIYRSIVHRRRDPGLLEYAGRRLIRARLFPIPARGETKVTLRYEQVLEPVGGMLELTYPMKTDKFSPGLVRMSGTIDVKDQAGIATLFSPTHKLDVARRGETHVIASFEENAAADRDLHVLYGKGRKNFGLSLATDRPAGEDGYFMMIISPNTPAGEADVLPKDIVFVVDTSGSMGDRGGEKLKQAKAALGYALGRLAPRDRFNVIAFATEPRAFRDTLLEASPENVQAALGFVNGLEATGGTCIHDALLEALAMPRTEGRVPLVLFLTDGEPTIGPTDPGVIATAVAGANAARARLFVFGVGDDVNAPLLARLSETNRGSAHFVTERENIELKVSALYDQIASPVLTDVTVSLDGAGTYDVYPREVGDLFKGQQVVLVGRYKTPGARAVTLRGRVGSRDVSLVYEGTFGEQAGREYLPRLWAIRKVGFLMAEIQRNGESAELVSEVKRLATRHGIVTPYTSWLVVEEGEMLRRNVALAAGAEAPPSELRRLREEAEATLGALETKAADMGAAGDALREGKATGVGAVAGAKYAAEYGRADRDDGATGVKIVAGKTFRLIDGIWTDLSYDRTADLVMVTVKYLSEEYDRLLEDATLARLLSVGARVRVVHNGKLYVVTE